ncbi:hypothetical protein AB0F64_24120 [Streptomyces sp. NPDC026294]|uniref:hypothetical protein n=1 Tax=Streptomyces sp. NPDC026294 TaxID=3155362 RepID=UPI0033FE9829
MTRPAPSVPHRSRSGCSRYPVHPASSAAAAKKYRTRSSGTDERGVRPGGRCSGRRQQSVRREERGGQQEHGQRPAAGPRRTAHRERPPHQPSHPVPALLAEEQERGHRHRQDELERGQRHAHGQRTGQVEDRTGHPERDGEGRQ